MNPYNYFNKGSYRAKVGLASLTLNKTKTWHIYIFSQKNHKLNTDLLKAVDLTNAECLVLTGTECLELTSAELLKMNGAGCL